MVEGSAAPGQQVIIVIQGIAKVNVDASSRSIQAGDTLMAAGNGHAVSLATTSLAAPEDDENANAREGESESEDTATRPTPSALLVGQALETLESGSGSIYVLIGNR